jgi:hypothetical protein
VTKVKPSINRVNVTILRHKMNVTMDGCNHTSIARCRWAGRVLTPYSLRAGGIFKPMDKGSYTLPLKSGRDLKRMDKEGFLHLTP